MARKKISEFRAKQIIHNELDLLYFGADTTERLDSKQKYVVKVDEGVKKRMKNGLVALNKSPEEVAEEIRKFQERGFVHFIVEPFLPHDPFSEKYLSIERIREGLQVLYSEKGGIDVEENQDSIKKIVVPGESSLSEVSRALGLDNEIFSKLLNAFDKYYFSFLEINPLVVENGKIYFLDIAAEVDSAGEFFAHEAWTQNDFRFGLQSHQKEEEKNIAELSQKSQASFNLTVLNPNGSIFMLLSGGGASIVLADEVYNLGFGKSLGNYGEYSGNPNAEEVYLYTKNILELLLKSNSEKKTLIIGGGVANFTNIAITFKGVIGALDERRETLKEHGVKIFVRRGGPHQEEGLAMMETFLKANNLYGLVADQTTTLPEIVQAAISEITV